MSDRWIQAMQKSGRFKNYNWDNTERVSVNTLDEKILILGKDYPSPIVIHEKAREKALKAFKKI